MDMGKPQGTLWITPDARGRLDLSLLYKESDPSRAFEGLEAIDRMDLPALLVLTPQQAHPVLADLEASERTEFGVVLWTDDPDCLHESLLEHPLVSGVLVPGSSPQLVCATLRAALSVLDHRNDQDRAAGMLEKVLEIGRALAAEKDLDTLLDLVLSHARELTGADGASIYTRDDGGKLYFRLWQNASTDARASAQKTLVGKYSVAGYVATTGELVNIEDAYTIPENAHYTFNPASDRSLNYRTRSMLTVPMTNKDGDVVGVLQLINRKLDSGQRLSTPEDFKTGVLPFDSISTQIALALAGQAGVALENSILYGDIERLFEGFIRASVQAIEARDPTTAGHSFRVAEFTERLGKAVDQSDLHSVRSVQFSRDQLQELRYAALLHDFGKVGVRENVLVKANKLYPEQLALIEQRFRYARTSLSRQAYREILDLYEASSLSAEELRGRRQEIERMLADEDQKLVGFLDTVVRANQPNVVHGAADADLATIVAYRFPDHDGNDVPLLDEFEFSSLALSRGSLSPEEREQIESHVSHTFEFLRLIPWTRNLARLPDIAYAHHEKLDGTGYPRGLGAAEIPVQSKMMTIADIYDALTAPDRPYKKAVPLERALDILGEESRAGKVDADLFRIFVDSRAFDIGAARPGGR
jgi:HD-GYP domain-containing protein (c-di-GMP phosphodiesterase class II)